MGGGDIDGGVLPDGAPGAAQPPDAEAVELHQFTGMVDLEMENRKGLRTFWLRWGGIAGDEAEALGPRAETMATEDGPDAVGGKAETTPERPGQFRRNAGRAEA